MSVVESGRYQLMMCECIDALSWMNECQKCKRLSTPFIYGVPAMGVFFSRLPYILSSKTKNYHHILCTTCSLIKALTSVSVSLVSSDGFGHGADSHVP